MAFEVKSSAFEGGQTIPRQYTCEGRDVSPPLSWSGVPAGTLSFALIADDPDAPVGTWVHWVLFDLPANAQSLAEGIPASATLSDGSVQGLNDFRRIGYGGPCPPPGKPHRYFFKLFALDRKLGLAVRSTKAQVLEAMKGHILGEASLMGQYRR